MISQTCVSHKKILIWLVVSTPLKNMSSSAGMTISNIRENKTCSKPPTSHCIPSLIPPFIDSVRFDPQMSWWIVDGAIATQGAQGPSHTLFLLQLLKGFTNRVRKSPRQKRYSLAQYIGYIYILYIYLYIWCVYHCVSHSISVKSQKTQIANTLW